MNLPLYPPFSWSVMQFQIYMTAQEMKGHIGFHAVPYRGLFLGRTVGYLILSMLE